MTVTERVPQQEAEGITTRAQRGLALYRDRGDEIVVYLDGTYGVPSRTEDGVLYHVDLEAGDPRDRCECPDATCRKVSCLHMVAAEAKRIGLARKSPAPRRRRCSAPPMVVRGQRARDFLARTGA